MTDESAPGAKAPEGQGGAGQTPALDVISAFGGIRPMAKALGVAVSTVQGWKERGAIPANRHDAILSAAKTQNVTLDEAKLRSSDQPGEAEDSTPAAKSAGQDQSKSASADKDKASSEPKKASEPSSRPASSGPSRVPPSGAPVPQHAGRVPSFLLGALVMALGFGLAFATVDLWGPSLGGGKVDTSALDGKIAGLESDVSKLQSTLKSQGGAGGQATAQISEIDKALAALKTETTGLSGRIKSLEASQGNTADSAELASLTQSSQTLADQLKTMEGKISGIESQLSTQKSLAAGEIAQLLAFDQLKANVNKSTPYGASLDRLRGTLKNDTDLTALLSPLNASASTGIPSLTRLRVDFPEVARAVVVAGASDDAGDGMFSGVWQKLATVVTVRPKGPVEGDSAGAVTARAEVLLNDGDLAGADAELGNLTGAAADAAADWRKKAEARLSADKALADFGDKLIDKMSAGG